ncbi:MAG: DUF3644 domain-containing protein [Dehalococcoidia bacterium]
MAGRRIYSVQAELLQKSKEAALNAVQTFNNPLTTFKTETFIVLMVVAWTYLLHAHYRRKGIEYRYFTQGKNRRRFDRTKSGAFKHWELERCLNEKKCPLDAATQANLRFLIGLRHEVEHHMSTQLDDHLGGRYLACCLNYETWVTQLFGMEHSLGASLALALQFRDLTANPEPTDALNPLPANVSRYIEEFDAAVGDEEFESPRFSYRILFTPKLANRRGQADRVIEFVPADSELAQVINAEYVVLKETERPKFRPKDVVQAMTEEGFSRFRVHEHTELWKQLDAKNPTNGYGVDVSGQWFWYERWLERVRRECREHPERFAALPDLGLSA